MSLAPPTSSNTIKPPQIILSQDLEEEATVSPDTKFTNPQKSTKILAFPPNRETLGGTSYLIVRNGGNILIDCPAWEQIAANQTYLRAVRWLFISHRGAIAKVAQIQQALDCEILIQEREAYLLPGLTLTTFSQELSLDDTTQ
ncbi:MBL fold metallo-hydrolase, partial [Cylindrospermopsis raciborskii CS-506_B]|nr:MBL fold metallo-hydrolase [Cylindrospermopsis raciborskii CS-506_B]